MADKSVQDFMNLTGASAEIARSLLEACSGNLELAIGMHLDTVTPHDHSNHGLEESDHTPPSSSLSPSTYQETHGVRAPIPQTQGVLIEQEPVPRRTFQRRKLPASVFDPFQDFSQMPSSSSSSSRKHQVLAELFKPPIDLMYQGTFHEARKYGQSQQRWLLVNLQDSREFKCQVLNRDIWRNASIRKLLKEHFIFIQIQRITDDGSKFQQLYGVDTFPTVLIIDPRTGEKMVNLQDLTVSSFLNEVQEFLAFNSLKNNHKSPNAKKSSIYDQSEKEQIEAAIRASMKEQTKDSGLITLDSDSDHLWSPGTDSDQCENETGEGKERSTAGGEGDSLCIVNITNNQQPSTSRHKRKRDESQYDGNMETDLTAGLLPPTKQLCLSNDTATRTSTHLASLPPSSLTVHIHDNHDIDGGEKGPSGEGAAVLVEMCTLLIRCPDGRRTLKSFRLDNPIRDLFTYLNEEGISLSQYEVITTFPRRVVSLLPRDTTFRQAGLYPRHTLYVQLIDDE
ncbi:PREDICTED: UBX domain-containing protein 7-like [Amphimedon queenslandica]|uniref:UBX domain-containing protein n=1 Tax=Amphimedon queenslandica TaxID=400682 RepID=A0A1X7V519_AMPQE|nr:PREDICTED: UBX domain-containing protein 7-like [Amphimedon queenslandica]|eukprot:XP_019850661.1 PREDICTED: UBX domain-containing protein 7-like [Amphimedon queenslandica]